MKLHNVKLCSFQSLRNNLRLYVTKDIVGSAHSWHVNVRKVTIFFSKVASELQTYMTMNKVLSLCLTGCQAVCWI